MYRSFAVGASRTQLASMAVFLWACMALAAQAQKPVVIEDFERYEVGEVPQDWSTNKGRSLIPASPETMTPEHEYRIVRERGNQFVRATMRDYAYRLIRINGDTFDWNLHAYPVLRWRWRIHEVPVGGCSDADFQLLAAAEGMLVGAEYELLDAWSELVGVDIAQQARKQLDERA